MLVSCSSTLCQIGPAQSLYKCQPYQIKRPSQSVHSTSLTIMILAWLSSSSVLVLYFKTLRNSLVTTSKSKFNRMYICTSYWLKSYLLSMKAVTSLHTYRFVSVPPRIVDSLSSSDMVQTEGSNVSLECLASGSPQPHMVWRREDAREITIDKNTTGETCQI